MKNQKYAVAIVQGEKYSCAMVDVDLNELKRKANSLGLEILSSMITTKEQAKDILRMFQNLK